MSLPARFTEFIEEKKYCKGVTPRTVEWYQQSLRWLPNTAPSADDLKQLVIRMRTAGLKETGCNCRIRAINAYLHWNSGVQEKCGPGCCHPKIPRLKEPKLVLPIFTDPQIKQLYTWKPKFFRDRRLHLIMLVLLDTGARITEALTIRVSDIDLANMLIKLDGKGRKERLVPFSMELRRFLFRYIKDNNRMPHLLLFASRSETQLHPRNVLRNVKNLCGRLGFRAPARTLHAFRHTFATKFIRQTRDVVTLQRYLGHASISQTMRYLHLCTEDLQKARANFSAFW